MSTKITAGAAMPVMEVPRVGGGTVRLGGEGRWQMVIVYRGKHCPICKRYLGGLDALKDTIESVGLDVVAISGDSAEQAQAVVDEVGVTIPVGYGLSRAQMQELGLYISTPRPNETDHEFPEPGLFVVNDKGQVQIVDISNAPFARPDLGAVMKGIAFIRERDYPIRGTVA
ncbi:MAG: peroxiredoxin-like family protein [Pseudomonadota bacterium]|nr:peroxiredoxin-like family protein [Pseudomonadota bacterium]